MGGGKGKEGRREGRGEGKGGEEGREGEQGREGEEGRDGRREGRGGGNLGEKGSDGVEGRDGEEGREVVYCFFLHICLTECMPPYTPAVHTVQSYRREVGGGADPGEGPVSQRPRRGSHLCQRADYPGRKVASTSCMCRQFMN